MKRNVSEFHGGGQNPLCVDCYASACEKCVYELLRERVKDVKHLLKKGTND